MPQPATQPLTTQDAEYTERLARSRSVWWKRWLDVQAPYRWALRALEPGFTLELGCGIGRNLEHLRGQAVGVDHNAASVALCRSRGLPAFTPEAFRTSEYQAAGRFDSLLLSHVAEHMRREEAAELVRSYAALVRPGGKLILITPQEAGYRRDPTHVELMDFEALAAIAQAAGFRLQRAFSFPFPRPVGRLFPYNEFVTVGVKP